jgi:hypothetical protein
VRLIGWACRNVNDRNAAILARDAKTARTACAAVQMVAQKSREPLTDETAQRHEVGEA